MFFYVVYSDIDIDITNSHGVSPFHIACQSGHLAAVKHFLTHFEVDLNATTQCMPISPKRSTKKPLTEAERQREARLRLDT